MFKMYKTNDSTPPIYRYYEPKIRVYYFDLVRYLFSHIQVIRYALHVIIKTSACCSELETLVL